MNKILNKIILMLTAALAMAPVARGYDLSRYSSSSRLASGRWVKIAVDESGIYQITSADAQKWGLGGDLSRVRVYGYGGAPLSERLSATSPDDLPQLPVLRTADRILFYAQGPLTYSENNEGGYTPVQHPYAVRGYYFVTTDDSDPAAPATSSIQPAGTVVNTYYCTLLHEQELINPGETGRNFLGEDFMSQSTQSFPFTLSGLVDGGRTTVTTNFAAKTVGTTSSLEFKCNGNNLSGTTTIASVLASDPDHYHYTPSKTTKEVTLTGTDQLTYTITHRSSGSLFLARLDNIFVNYTRHLTMQGLSSLYFGIKQTSGKQMELSGTGANTHVWDITTPHSPVELNLSGDGGTVRFSTTGRSDSRFIAFNEGGTFPSPAMVETVASQDLHGLEIPDMIILAPSEFLSYARQIASLHESQDSMRVHVIDHTLVFNEFSSGTPDAMAYRALCKYFYDRGADAQGHHLQYLLFMGNGMYDNRLISTAARAAAYPKLLLWESENSSDENWSFTTDDYYGWLDDDAQISVNPSKSDNMRIAVGRIPARSASDAGVMVNKIIKYSTKDDYGSWKNNMLNVADNGDTSDHWIHGEEVVDTIARHGGESTIFNRVFLDNYEEVSDGSGSKFPEARKKMFKTLTEGTLWWNYSGHGGPTGWTNDGLLMTNDIANNMFYSHLPILFAATCEFSRHDGAKPSGGENLLTNPNGGIVGMICPPRLVFMVDNRYLNVKAAEVMMKRDESGQLMTLGQILNYAKNNTVNARRNSLKYVLYGDPAMRPAMPRLRAVVDRINGQAVSEDNMPVFQARQTMTVTGHIENMKGNRATDFNGLVESSLFDCEQSVTFIDSSDKAHTYEDRPNKLAVNVTKVTNGEFSINITIPSEVTVTYDNYRPSLVSLYAYDAARSLEATGNCDEFYIYGYDETVLADTIGPDIGYMGLNSNNFKDGDNVNESPLFLATVSDESGINFSSAGIGHNMTLTLDGTTTFSDVSSYYTPVEAETGSAGAITYALSDLANGHHTLRLKVWDVFNNSGEKTINFNVVSGLTPEIDEIKAYPNPASSYTNFIVTHNRPEATVTITVEVFNLMGQRVWSTTQSGRSSMFSSFPVTWDLSDYSGTRLQRGIYIYRATITTDGRHERTKSKKLAITAQ